MQVNVSESLRSTRNYRGLGSLLEDLGGSWASLSRRGTSFVCALTACGRQMEILQVAPKICAVNWQFSKWRWSRFEPDAGQRRGHTRRESISNLEGWQSGNAAPC